jgi:hypothetical protein
MLNECSTTAPTTPLISSPLPWYHLHTIPNYHRHLRTCLQTLPPVCAPCADLFVGTIQSLTSSVVACRLTASLALPLARSARSWGSRPTVDTITWREGGGQC